MSLDHALDSLFPIQARLPETEDYVEGPRAFSRNARLTGKANNEGSHYGYRLRWRKDH